MLSMEEDTLVFQMSNSTVDHKSLTKPNYHLDQNCQLFIFLVCQVTLNLSK